MKKSSTFEFVDKYPQMEKSSRFDFVDGDYICHTHFLENMTFRKTLYLHYSHELRVSTHHWTTRIARTGVQSTQAAMPKLRLPLSSTWKINLIHALKKRRKGQGYKLPLLQKNPCPCTDRMKSKQHYTRTSYMWGFLQNQEEEPKGISLRPKSKFPSSTHSYVALFTFPFEIFSFCRRSLLTAFCNDPTNYIGMGKIHH